MKLTHLYMYAYMQISLYYTYSNIFLYKVLGVLFVLSTTEQKVCYIQK